MIIKASPTICDLSLFMAWKLQSYIRLMGWWEMVILLPDYDMNEQSRSLTIQKYLNTMQRSARVIFFNLETRMRISPTQSCTSRRDREFLTLNLRLRDETEKKSPPILSIETRSKFIIFILRLRDENENSLDLISVFETRTRILKVAIFPWIQAWTASLFCMQFLGG